MILVDFSSIVHRKIYTSVSRVNPRKENDKFITSEFIGLTKYYILEELFSIKQEHEPKFGNLVICLDEKKSGYWREKIYPMYKSNRREGKEESEINYSEVFHEINILIDQIRKNLPFKVVEVDTAEADDLMLVLSRHFSQTEKILIHSPDKDMIQAQRYTDNVFQYSSLTSKWIVPENKHENMDEWLLEHVCLGDGSDGVPRVIDHTLFSENFIKYLETEGYPGITDPLVFKDWNIPREEKIALVENYNVYRTNRKGEQTELDIYKKVRFGSSNLKKKIKEHGGLDEWLDSHPMYRPHYERNFKLVMEEGIPTDIFNEIILKYTQAESTYNFDEFSTYLKENNMKTILMDLPSIFINSEKQEICAEDFNW